MPALFSNKLHLEMVTPVTIRDNLTTSSSFKIVAVSALLYFFYAIYCRKAVPTTRLFSLFILFNGDLKIEKMTDPASQRTHFIQFSFTHSQTET
jgi:hypothetical protein